MIVFSSNKAEFIHSVRSNGIDRIIEAEVLRKLNRRTPKSELNSWKNSLQYMMNVLLDDEIPNSAKVAVEYNIPRTSNRIDFILTGKDVNHNEHAVIIELKQWEIAKKTNKDAIVETFLGKSIRETNHPSYQAWSYASMINDYNETVRDENINLAPCAYLHNMVDGNDIKDPFYSYHIDHAPVFLNNDAFKLAEFIKKHIRFGDSNDIMYRIENGKIKPSKNLADSLASMLKGNKEFILLDNQKLVYETAIDFTHKSQNDKKHTLIVKGGPGTGKSVVAINLLVELTKRQLVAQYVSKNAAPRAVFTTLLKGTQKKKSIDYMFKGSGSYVDCQENTFDALIVDEAHRLNEKSGLYSNLGENQIKELIYSSKLSVFFLDEDQKVTIKDIGSIEEIQKWSKVYDADVTILELESQFRCNGSDGYLAWIDNTLQLKNTANETLDDIDYDIQVFDDPIDLKNEIFKKNSINNKSRLVAGYCWPWVSKKDPNQFDFELLGKNGVLKAQWNLTKDGSLWLIAEESVNEIGCIHTCQGLELDYVGVIIGDDLLVRNGKIITDTNNRASQDRSVFGMKKMIKENESNARELGDILIKNTYRTLMTRGQKGCYLYSEDKETREFFKSALSNNIYEEVITEDLYLGLSYSVKPLNEVTPYQGYVPIYNLAAAAGDFSDWQYMEDYDWVELPDIFSTQEGMFVMQVIGESMNKRIPNGSWCLFKSNPSGTRNSKIVLAEHRDIIDPDHGGRFTVKRYYSEKQIEDEQVVNSKISLKPETNAFGYKPIIIENPEDGFNIIGEFIAVL